MLYVCVLVLYSCSHCFCNDYYSFFQLLRLTLQYVVVDIRIREAHAAIGVQDQGHEPQPCRPQRHDESSSTSTTHEPSNAAANGRCGRIAEDDARDGWCWQYVRLGVVVPIAVFQTITHIVVIGTISLIKCPDIVILILCLSSVIRQTDGWSQVDFKH